MVIQRWQSVLLLVAVVLMGCFSFVSLGQIQTPDVTFNFTALGIFPEGQPTGAEHPGSISTWYLFAISILSAILPLIAIFSFKNLKLQKRLCLISELTIIFTIIDAAFLAYQNFDGGSISWSSMICAPFISMISVAMAYQRIESDRKKIQESERLR